MKVWMPECSEACTPQLWMPQPAMMVTSLSSPMKKSLYTMSFRPLMLSTTGMWTDSFRVPGLMMISMPSLSVLVTMSMLAVVFRPAFWPLARML